MTSLFEAFGGANAERTQGPMRGNGLGGLADHVGWDHHDDPLATGEGFLGLMGDPDGGGENDARQEGLAFPLFLQGGGPNGIEFPKMDLMPSPIEVNT